MKFRNWLYRLLTIFSPLYNYVTRKRLRVLAYHDVPKEDIFEEQIKYLSKNYNIITIKELEEHLFKGAVIKEKSLLITFDDGDISVYTIGLPILKKYNVPASLFVVTSLIGTQSDFWWETIRKNEKIKGSSTSEIIKKINQHKNYSNSQRLKSLSFYQETNKQQLDIKELRELEKNNVQICNHSHTHPMFNKCEDSEIIEETEKVREKFRSWKIGNFQYFAYPNGNYSEKSKKLFQIYGIKLAFLFDHKLNKPTIDAMRISRLAVDADTPMFEFKTKVSGLHSQIFHLKNKR